MRFLVCDEDSIPIRKFWSLEEAKAHLLEHWTIKVLPKAQKPKHCAFSDILNDVGEAPF